MINIGFKLAETGLFQYNLRIGNKDQHICVICVSSSRDSINLIFICVTHSFDLDYLETVLMYSTKLKVFEEKIPKVKYMQMVSLYPPVPL